MDGCTLDTDVFRDCEAVLVREDVRVMGAVVFDQCTILNSGFYRITFLITPGQWSAFPSNLKKGLTLISYGPPKAA
jgi:hypothetical protein